MLFWKKGTLAKRYWEKVTKPRACKGRAGGIRPRPGEEERECSNGKEPISGARQKRSDCRGI